jgi:N-acylneuraminate cytidylyltransferase
MRTCAIIPARGGSKGIPGKNLQRVGGFPLIVRSVMAARAASSIDEVFVSTDDEAIAAAARDAGAQIIDRPAEIAGDAASSEAAIFHALEWLRQRDGALPQALAFIQCTSPFTTAADLDAGYATMQREGADSVFAAVPFHGFAWRRGAEGSAVGSNHDWRSRPRRQDREPEYLETGAFYWLAVDGLLAARHRFFGRIEPHVINSINSFEIDDPADLARARALAGIASSPLTGLLAGREWRALVMDFDGVLTDDLVTVDETGVEAVVCSRSDGMGIDLLRRALPSLVIAVLSREANAVVARRCEKLRIECMQGVLGKREVLGAWLAEHSIEPSQTIYVGNDVTDVECLQLAGLGLAPADAHATALAAAGAILSRRGGQGAIREICDALLAASGPSA